ncbi:hypothetical protein [Streptomyces morookaense]|uniref:Uncharacterized protein n=1 Tax=Streptomyces morookaense TaxID=1970 RepID=A0A7Y7EAH8_STRMO|nr:hypothetical protein [Streptomyces morookaense]NVK81539.1 hypothetical protein [Streptomyces morookaense]GHF55151.1 hypothetical protein GCM10010359_66680 [Streptomyces morookaense]
MDNLVSRGGSYLAKEAETLTTFKGRIDELLAKLEKSSASPKAIGERRIAKEAYGRGFDSAGDLAALYDKVHGRLQELSKLFGDQIEATGLAALISDRGYDGVDAEQAARMRAIQESTQKHYRDAAGTNAPAKGSGTTQQHTGDAGGADGF